MTNTDNEIVTIPMIVHEAAEHRFKKIIAMVSVGWAASTIALGAAVACVLLR